MQVNYDQQLEHKELVEQPEVNFVANRYIGYTQIMTDDLELRFKILDLTGNWFDLEELDFDTAMELRYRCDFDHSFLRYSSSKFYSYVNQN